MLPRQYSIGRACGNIGKIFDSYSFLFAKFRIWLHASAVSYDRLSARIAQVTLHKTEYCVRFCNIRLNASEYHKYVKQYNRSTGNKGENAAVERLQSEGYEILDRNFRNKWGEVDIVARKDNRTVFVEVKTKTGDEYGEPWEMINKHKLKQVENMGHLWCEEYGWDGLCRIDVVGVWLDENGEIVRTEHWEDVQM